MLEPPTPAGEPFAAQEVDESNSKMSADFESVCISLVERGWKIMPKKGTYPINKKGPRYINLVDPRGNRKSVRVIDEGLWEKLRAAEARRTGKRIEDIEGPKTAESSSVEIEVPSSGKGSGNQPMVESISTSTFDSGNNSSSISGAPSMTETDHVTTADSPHVIEEPATFVEEGPVAEMADVHSEEVQSHLTEEPAQKAEILENPPREIQNFALSSPGLQKSIFDLGFETLLNALQSETLTPAEIIGKIQEWSLESKNLLEFVHKTQEKTQVQSALPDTSEKDQLITELQSTLKEVEDKLAETIKSLNEM